jgi:agmatine/peptidylarginine deiminase
MNFIITRSLIILPSYLSENSNLKALQNKEEEVKVLFQKTFPSKEIILVPIEGLNYFSGGFHCISYNEPQFRN